MEELQGKTALISGASSGIGLSLAKVLGREGARVAITGTSARKLSVAVETLRALGIQALAFRFDVADEQGWRDTFLKVENCFGPVRFLALNAGIGSDRRTIESTPTAAWFSAWNTNVMGIVHGLQACLPGMKASGLESHVLITSSLRGVLRSSMMAPYAVTKGAAIALAEILRVELKGTSIKPSLLIPGPVRTPFRETSQRHSTVKYDSQAETDLQRYLDSIGINPDDVATFVLEQIYKGAFYIFTHFGNRAAISDQFQELLAASDIGITTLRATSAE